MYASSLFAYIDISYSGNMNTFEYIGCCVVYATTSKNI